MSLPKKALTGNQSASKPVSAKPLTSSGAHRAALQGPVSMSAGAGQTWSNLTRQDVDEELRKRGICPAASSPSFWRKFTGLFTKPKKIG